MRFPKIFSRGARQPRGVEPVDEEWAESFIEPFEPDFAPDPQIHGDSDSFMPPMPRDAEFYAPNHVPVAGPSGLSHVDDLTDVDYGSGQPRDTNYYTHGRRRDDEYPSHGRRRSRSRGKTRTRRQRIPEIVIHPPSNASLAGQVRSTSPLPLPVPPRLARGPSFGNSGSRFAESRSIQQGTPRRDAPDSGIRARDFAYDASQTQSSRTRTRTRNPKMSTYDHTDDGAQTRDMDTDARQRHSQKQHGGFFRKLHSLEHPNFQYSECTGRKKAICIGINYVGQSSELQGCINDAKDTERFLIKHQRYPSRNILTLTDDASDPQNLPTRANITAAMHWLVDGAQTHDSLFIHYSGHGARAKDVVGDESDGYDEMIFPVDYKHAGTILDDELNKILIKPLPPGCRLTAVFDSCHSGSVLDLVYNYHSNGKVKRTPVRKKFIDAKTTPGDVMCWSGCNDEGTSADVNEGGLAVGAMSYAFLKVLKGNPDITYEQLLKGLRRETGKYKQKPQLSASHRMDIDRRFVM